VPEPNRPGDRSAEQREADHAGLARLSDTLVPALVAKLNASGLGELEVREGDWRVRLRRPTGATSGVRRADRPRLGIHTAPHASQPVPAAATSAATSSAGPPATDTGDPPPDPRREAATSPAVGVFRVGVSVGTRVRAGDRIAVVDLLGIPQEVFAPIDGILVEVLATGGDAVEYGEEVAVVEAELPEPAAPPAGDAALPSAEA
jgi:acetyl-CoA carboxylase biotin carboxyl carrier protein